MRSLILKVSLLLVVSLAAIFIGELLLRTFFPLHLAGVLRAYQYDEELGVRLKPSYDHLATTDFQSELHTNALGTVNFQEDFSAYEKLIFTAGDSYTQGTGLRPDSSYQWLKAWAAQRGVRFADWWPRARSLKAMMPRLSVLNPHSSGHYRPWVNQMIAQSFAEAMRTDPVAAKETR